MQAFLMSFRILVMCLGLAKISLILGKSQRVMVVSLSMSILVLKNSFTHFSRHWIPWSMSWIASLDFFLKIVRRSILLRTCWQISVEIASKMSSNFSSLWFMCLEMVQMSLRPLRRDCMVSMIDLSSPLLMYLNCRSRVAKNLTKSFAWACCLPNSLFALLKLSIE